MMGFA